MNTFELNEESLRKGWGGSDQYWFSLKDFKIKEASALADMDKPENVSQTAYFVSNGYIPYFVVTNEEVMRSYVDSLTNEKLKNALSKIDKDNYVESFWKYFNVYPQMAEGFEDFEKNYLIQKATKWCDENSIPYILK